jgi:hypothetical protein
MCNPIESKIRLRALQEYGINIFHFLSAFVIKRVKYHEILYQRAES